MDLLGAKAKLVDFMHLLIKSSLRRIPYVIRVGYASI